MKKTVLALLLAVPAAYVNAQCPNLVPNGDFEAGNINFVSQYTYVAPPLNPTSLYGEGAYAITTNPRLVHSNYAIIEDHTSGSGTYMMVTNSSVQPNTILWSQSVAVKPGTNYTLEAWANGVVTAYPARLKFYINGTQVGSTFTVGVRVWTQFTASWNAGMADHALITIINDNTEAGGNDFALDDIALKVASVPTVSVADVSTFGNTNTIYTGYGPQSLTFTAAGGSGEGPYTYQLGDGAFSSSPSFTITDAGNYSINVKDANNCISTVSASITVTVKDVRCGNNNNKVMVCHNTASTNNPNNGLCIAPDAVPTHLAHGDALGDCPPSNARMIHSNGAVATSGVSVFPNPARGQITVAFKDAGSYDVCQIIDISGRAIISRPIEDDAAANGVNIDVSQLRPGVYTMRAISHNKAEAIRFIIE